MGRQTTILSNIKEFIDEPIPDSVREHGVLTVADILSATTAGSAVAPIEQIGRDTKLGEGPSTIIGTDRQVRPEQAALVNASASVTQEIEEGHNEAGHVGACLVVGGFAMAERESLDGEAFVDACIRAYEISARLEWGLQQMKSEVNRDIPWSIRNPHVTWTTTGPALAAGLSAGMDAETLIETFLVAANTGVVSMHDPYEEGSMTRNIMAGFSAQTGVSTALLTEAGLQGSRSSLDAIYGPIGDRDPEFNRRFTTLGDNWEVTRNYFKYTPSCRFTHPPLDALKAVQEELRPDEINHIDVYMFDSSLAMDYEDPAPFTSAKFSIPYVLAAYLVNGDLGFDDFDTEAVANDTVRSLAERISVNVDPEYEASFPSNWASRVEITRRDGTQLVGECEHPIGDYRNREDEELLLSKFESLIALRLGKARATEAVDALLDLRNREVSEIGALLRA